MAEKKTQTERVLDYMRQNGGITQAEAIRDLGCYRLGARVYDLRRSGHSITRYMVSEKNRYGVTVCFARYKLGREEA